MTTSLETKKQILAAQITQKRSKNNEERLEKELSKFFAKLKDQVLSALTEYWSEYQMLQGQVDLICSPIHEAHREYYEILEKYNKREYKIGVSEAKRLVRIASKQWDYAEKSEITPIPMSAVIDKDELFGTLPSAEEDMLNKTFTASQNTMSRIDSQINQIITDGYRSGKGINSISNDLTRRFNQLETWEAKRIARTEIHGSHNTAVMDTYRDLGVEYTQWISKIDKRTRTYRKGDKADHIKMDGEIIAFGEEYSNGLAFPGDTRGKIEEWVNCRCSNAPFVMPFGFIAPSFSPFKESDLVAVPTRTPQQLIENAKQPTKPQVNPQITKLEQELKELKEIEAKWRARGNPIADTFAKDAERVQKELDKLKKPTIKVIKEPKPKIDVDNILAEVLDEYGLNKPKTQKKPKKTKAKSQPKEEPTITLKEHLRNELPSEFTDEALDYIVDKVKKRGNAKREYGQIFDYKTGRNTSPEFKGGKSAVNIKEEDWIKPPKQMTRAEQIDALSNPSKYKKSFVDKSDSLASIHNHPSDGSRAFSGADINITLTNKWEDFGLAISDKEIWCSEYKGTMNFIDAKEIEKKVDRLFNKSKKQAMKKVMSEYDDLPLKEKREIEAELLKDIFGDNLLDFFNNKNKDWGIKLRRVRYVE